MSTAAIGFRAKTGRAITVVLSGDGSGPAFVWRDEISLVDPDLPDTAQPYHVVMDLPWPEAMTAVRPLAAAIESVAARAVAGIVAEMQRRGLQIRGAGVVGSPDRRLESLGNLHIRAHAAEGILFRRVLETAAAASSLPCRAFSDRDFPREVATLKATMKELGRAAGPPWQIDERLAAAAALRMLSPG